MPRDGLPCQALDVDTPDRDQIFSKTRHGRHKEVEELLDLGAPVDGQDPYGNTVSSEFLPGSAMCGADASVCGGAPGAAHGVPERKQAHREGELVCGRGGLWARGERGRGEQACLRRGCDTNAQNVRGHVLPLPLPLPRRCSFSSLLLLLPLPIWLAAGRCDVVRGGEKAGQS